MDMWKLDVLQIPISASAIFGISVLWYVFSKKVLDTVCDLSLAMILDEEEDDKD